MCALLLVIARLIINITSKMGNKAFPGVQNGL